MKDICNKFIEINFCFGCMVWPWLHLFQHWTFVKYWWDKSMHKHCLITFLAHSCHVLIRSRLDRKNEILLNMKRKTCKKNNTVKNSFEIQGHMLSKNRLLFYFYVSHVLGGWHHFCGMDLRMRLKKRIFTKFCKKMSLKFLETNLKGKNISFKLKKL